MRDRDFESLCLRFCSQVAVGAETKIRLWSVGSFTEINSALWLMIMMYDYDVLFMIYD